jgi:hypothetical protein
LKKRPNIFVRIKNALCFHRRSRYVAADVVPNEVEVVDSKHLVKDEENETATSDGKFDFLGISSAILCLVTFIKLKTTLRFGPSTYEFY